MNAKVNKLKKCLYTLLISMVCFLFTPVTVEACESQYISVVNFDGEDELPKEIKEPIEKGMTLLEYLVVTIGIVVLIVGIVLLAISFFGHQNDMKIAGFIGVGAGIVIIAAPFIAKWIAGR